MKKIPFLIVFCFCLIFSFAPSFGSVAMAKTSDETYYIPNQKEVSSVTNNPIFYPVNFIYNNIIYPNGSVERSFSVIANQPNLSEKFWSEIEFYLTYMGYQTTRDGFSSITGSIQFESLTDSYIASGRDGFEVDTNDNTKVVYDGLYKIYNSESDTVFSYVNKENNLVSIINDVLVADYGVGSVCYIYQYGTKYKPSFISSSADKVIYLEDARVFIHQFVFTADEVDNVVILTQKMLNSDIFSTLAILVGIIIIIATSFGVRQARSKNNG